jgi:hypothetical protein
MVEIGTDVVMVDAASPLPHLRPGSSLCSVHRRVAAAELCALWPSWQLAGSSFLGSLGSLGPLGMLGMLGQRLCLCGRTRSSSLWYDTEVELEVQESRSN